MKENQPIKTAHEIAFEIFYSRATNGQAPVSIERGAKLIEDYASQFKQSESQQPGGLRWIKATINNPIERMWYHTKLKGLNGKLYDSVTLFDPEPIYAGKNWDSADTVVEYLLEEKEDSSPVPQKVFIAAYVKDLLQELDTEQISFSRFVEKLNEKVSGKDSSPVVGEGKIYQFDKTAEASIQEYCKDDNSEELREDALQALLKLSPDGEDADAAVIQDIIIELTRRAITHDLPDTGKEESKCPVFTVERFADNGEHSHWDLINDDGEILVTDIKPKKTNQ